MFQHASFHGSVLGLITEVSLLQALARRTFFRWHHDIQISDLTVLNVDLKRTCSVVRFTARRMVTLCFSARYKWTNVCISWCCVVLRCVRLSLVTRSWSTWAAVWLVTPIRLVRSLMTTSYEWKNLCWPVWHHCSQLNTPPTLSRPIHISEHCSCLTLERSSTCCRWRLTTRRTCHELTSSVLLTYCYCWWSTQSASLSHRSDTTRTLMSRAD